MNKEVVIMVGTPLVGKTTYIKEHYPNHGIISRDEILMEVAGTRDYNLAFRKADQKLVDKILLQRLTDAGKSDKNFVIDMTHMTSGRRKSNLSYFKNHYKVAVIFPFLSKSEWEVRNEKRKREEDKNIPWEVMEKMKSSYEPVKENEGFDELIYVD